MCLWRMFRIFLNVDLSVLGASVQSRKCSCYIYAAPVQLRFCSSCSSSKDANEPRLKEMIFLTIVLLSAAVLDRSIGKEETEEGKEGEEEEEEEDDTTTGSGITPEQQKFILDKHNEIRRNVVPTAANMLKMIWNETLGESARMWAEKCIRENSPEDSRKLGDMPCGETIFQSNQVMMWPDIIDFWMNGKTHFKYGVGAIDPRKNIFAYTQLVWYNSYLVGCAVAHCPEITFPFVYICHYCPGGNLMSQISKPYKEGPSCGDCPKACEDKLCTNPCKYTDTVPNCRDMKKVYSCKNKLLVNSCKATCKCKKQIV